MGFVGRPEDLAGRRRRLIGKSLQDLSPSLKERVIDILEAWEEEYSEKKLINLIGKEKTRFLIKTFKK